MGYDLDLCDPVTGEVLQCDTPHHMKGSTYAVGGSTHLGIAVTYNYAPHFNRTIEGGLRSLDGKSGAESIAILKKAIAALGDDVTGRYWDSTEGNAKLALTQVLALAQMRPDGVWRIE